MADADTTYFKAACAGLIEDLLVAESKTAPLAASADVVATFQNGKVGRIPSLTIGELTDYVASAGYDASLVGCTWEDKTLPWDRGKKLILDEVKTISDNAAIPTAGLVLGEFMRKAVIPEIDRARIAGVATEMAGVAGHISTGYTPAKSTIIGKIADGLAAIQDETGADIANIIVNGKYRGMVEQSSEISRSLNVRDGNGSINNRVLDYNGCPLTFCPSTRMYSAIEKKSSGALGATSGAKEVVAVIALPGAVQGVVSRDVTKIIEAQNSEMYDAASVAVRICHGCFVPAKMQSGVYVITT